MRKSSLLILLLLLAALLCACGAPAPEAPEETAPPAETPPEKTEATLAWLGDVVCHEGLNEEAWDGAQYDYVPVFSGSANYVAEADYAFCCLETTFPDTEEYTGYPQFRSPKELARGLKALGFDLVNTASNHAMDSFKSGVDATLDVLDGAGLEHVGTYRTQEERDEGHGVVVKDLNGIRVAFLAYTYGTNAIPVTGFEYAVNIVFKDYLTVFREPDYELMEADLDYARSLEPDFVAVLIHWGNEYYTEPFPWQVELADWLFSKGADLVLGGHVHVPAPMEVRRVTGPDGREKTGYLCYCLGNYVSSMNDPYTNLTAAVTLTLEKDHVTGEAYLKNVGYAPLFMVDLEDYGVRDAGWRYRLWDLHAAIDDYERGIDRGVITPALYGAMKRGLEDIHSIYPARYDMFDPSYVENTEGELKAQP